MAVAGGAGMYRTLPTYYNYLCTHITTIAVLIPWLSMYLCMAAAASKADLGNMYMRFGPQFGGSLVMCQNTLGCCNSE